MAAMRAVLLSACASSSLAYVMPAALPRGGRAAAVRMEQGVEKSIPMMPGQKTWMPKAEDTAMAAKKWHLVDAEGLRLGRMSSEIAKLLLGKHKPEFTPGCDVGDCIVVINAEKVIVTGKKFDNKLYRRHSGRPGSMKIETFSELQQRIPERCASGPQGLRIQCWGSAVLPCLAVALYVPACVSRKRPIARAYA
jgi:large subunit ribosomal protein L13